LLAFRASAVESMFRKHDEQGDKQQHGHKHHANVRPSDIAALRQHLISLQSSKTAAHAIA
jgi:hypothetical protein